MRQTYCNCWGNKSQYWLGYEASTDGALNLVTSPRCQQITGTPEHTGILAWDQSCAEPLQKLMKRTIYASTANRWKTLRPSLLTMARLFCLGHRNSALKTTVIWHSCFHHACNSIICANSQHMSSIVIVIAIAHRSATIALLVWSAQLSQSCRSRRGRCSVTDVSMLVNKTKRLIKRNWKCKSALERRLTLHFCGISAALQDLPGNEHLLSVRRAECQKFCSSRHMVEKQMNVICYWWYHASLGN